MKSIISKTMVLITICAALFSFSPKPGGEGFEIYLNNKAVIQQYGNEMNTVKSLQLNQSLSNGQLTIKYHHCGKVGKNRIVTIKDGQNKILKEFRYADAPTPVAAMALNVKDIVSLRKGNNNSLKLSYSSSELPDGRVLATISLTAD
jgi:DNA-directed RNA polymerase beta' subunit